MQRLALFYKIDAGLCPIILPANVLRKETTGRTDNSKAYVHMISNSNTYFYSYYVRTIRDWNLLAENLVSTPSFDSFVLKLKIAIA